MHPYSLALSLFLMVSSPKMEMRLWPGAAPGDVETLPPESSSTQGGLVGGKTVTKLSNVATPNLTIYRAPSPAAGRPAVVVFPGGGYNILATDIEGTEIADFLNDHGMTAVVVKYRVPRRKNRPVYEAPLQDAQRAMGLIRQHAAEWGLNPDQIGILGFSAGGNLAAMLSTHFVSRIYDHVDAADDLSCRPDFAILTYPAYLSSPEGSMTLAPELTLAANTPPTFLVQTEDDPIHAENSLAYYFALLKAHIPSELHIYSKGGHGYGLRNTASPVNRWGEDLLRWLQWQKVLSPVSKSQ